MNGRYGRKNEIALKSWWEHKSLIRLENVRSFKQMKAWHVGNNSSFVFNITYHPVLLKLKNVPSEIHLLLTRGREHGKVFKRIPTVCFRRAKRLKDILVRVKVAPLEKKKGS